MKTKSINAGIRCAAVFKHDAAVTTTILVSTFAEIKHAKLKGVASGTKYQPISFYAY